MGRSSAYRPILRPLGSKVHIARHREAARSAEGALSHIGNVGSAALIRILAVAFSMSVWVLIFVELIRFYTR